MKKPNTHAGEKHQRDIHTLLILYRSHCTCFKVNCYYRQQRSWAKVIFSQACVKNSVHRGEGGCLPHCMLGYTFPPRPGTFPPRAHPPSILEQTPPKPGKPPRADTPREADCSMQSTSGQYASYWNAFLFLFNFTISTNIYRDNTARLTQYTIHWEACRV